ncbi:MAG: tetratricopeptide repeat protein [Planctomycetota bacterium]|jgi:tetratricopeptide (TPR) repeat protein
MNAGKHKILLQMLLILVVVQTAFADSARVSTSLGNQLYEKGKFDEAIGQYDQALIDRPEALEPKFNKANSYYRLDDLGQAVNLYREVAAESKNMKLVTKAKYNLGNCSFQQGSKQRDSNLQKAIEEMETAIGHWRAVLDIEPEGAGY